MKKWHKILRVFLLVSIYCFGVYVPAKTALNSSAQTFEQHKEQKEYLNSASKILYPHTQQLENSISDITECSFSNFDLSSIEGFWTITYPEELLFNARFKQYKNYLKTLLIRQRKSDLIFPFHNFW